MRPLVAVTTDRRVFGPGAGPRVRPARPWVGIGEALVDEVRRAGGHAVLLPPGDEAAAGELLDRIDAIVIAGGAFDIHPRHYGQAVVARLDRVEEDRTALELALCREAVRRDLPTLGICGGMQALAVALGGTLVQDVPTAVPDALPHEQPGDPARPGHPLRPSPGWDWLGDEVNSTHHQAVDDPGPLEVVARAPDGVVEAVALAGARFVVGVQWHPELLAQHEPFRRLIAAASPSRTLPTRATLRP